MGDRREEVNRISLVIPAILDLYVKGLRDYTLYHYYFFMKKIKYLKANLIRFYF